MSTDQYYVVSCLEGLGHRPTKGLTCTNQAQAEKERLAQC